MHLLSDLTVDNLRHTAVEAATARVVDGRIGIPHSVPWHTTLVSQLIYEFDITIAALLHNSSLSVFEKCKTQVGPATKPHHTHRWIWPIIIGVLVI